MEERNLLYTVRYPEIDLEELDREMRESEKWKKYDAPYPTGESFIKHILEDSEYVPIPHRLKRKAFFIQLAKQLSTEYKIDADIF